jgi:ribonuclease HII
MKFLIGVDEAGRGPLAGPVAVGLVAVPEGFDVAAAFPGVRDSKQLSEKKREKIFEMLEARAGEAGAGVRYTVEFESAEAIDQEGIVSVIRRAVARGVDRLVADVRLTKSNICIQLDGGLKAPEEYAQETIIHGDALVPIISLASIAAKVTRDRLMVALAETYPGYYLEEHKGYGTKKHYEALKKLGPSAIHRRSFLNLAPRDE